MREKATALPYSSRRLENSFQLGKTVAFPKMFEGIRFGSDRVDDVFEKPAFESYGRMNFVKPAGEAKPIDAGIGRSIANARTDSSTASS